MNNNYTRRSFINKTGKTFAGASGILALSGFSAIGDVDKTPKFKISLAQWSIHRHLFGHTNFVFPSNDEQRREFRENIDKFLTGDLTNLDFAQVTRREFDIDAVDYVNIFFFDKARDEKYLTEMKSRADNEGVKNQLIMCDAEGPLGAPDPLERTASIERHYKWVDAAAHLGCHSIRVNAQSAGTWDEQRKLAAEGLIRLAEYADKSKINVIVENHGGNSSNGKWLASVMETVNHPRVGTLPDFGNFHISDTEEYDKYLGVKELMPYAKAVSAKTYNFDANGNEPDVDFYRLLKIVSEGGYSGYLGIEYEGDNLSEFDGIRATLALIKRVLSGMT
jgi:L-ribulose-5-phosphate 3-epimerase